MKTEFLHVRIDPGLKSQAKAAAEAAGASLSEWLADAIGRAIDDDPIEMLKADLARRVSERDRALASYESTIGALEAEIVQAMKRQRRPRGK